LLVGLGGFLPVVVIEEFVGCGLGWGLLGGDWCCDECQRYREVENFREAGHVWAPGFLLDGLEWGTLARRVDTAATQGWPKGGRAKAPSPTGRGLQCGSLELGRGDTNEI